MRQDPFGQTPFLPPPPSKSNNRGAFTQHGRYQFVDPQQQQQQQQQQSQNSNDNKYAALEMLGGAPQQPQFSGQASQQSNFSININQYT